MVRIVYIVVFALLIVVGCKQPQQGMSVWNIPEAVYWDCAAKDSLLLRENIGFLGNSVRNFAALTDTSFLLSGGNNLFVYSLLGHQTGTFGCSGEGPFQYMRPDLFYVSDSLVYIFDRVPMKLYVYDKAGLPIRDYKLSCRGIADFAVYRDSLLCCLYDGTEEDKTLEVYELSSMRPLKTIRQKTEEDQVLYLAERAGGICISGDSVYWCTPSRLALYVLDLTHSGKAVVQRTYVDDDFEVEELEGKAYDLINENKKFVLDYMAANSRVTQVDIYNGDIYLLAETGKIEMAPDGMPRGGSRSLKVYRISLSNGKPQHVYQLDYPKLCALAKLQGGRLYLFRASFTEDDMEVWMEQVTFPAPPLAL